jgi:hypothetical protein
LNGQVIGKAMLCQLSKIAEASKHYLFFGLRNCRFVREFAPVEIGSAPSLVFEASTGRWRDSAMAAFSCLPLK